MVNATEGSVVECDIPIKEYIIWLNQSQHEKFIILDLDQTHLFIQTHAISLIRKELEKLHEENNFVVVT